MNTVEEFTTCTWFKHGQVHQGFFNRGLAYIFSLKYHRWQVQVNFIVLDAIHQVLFLRYVRRCQWNNYIGMFHYRIEKFAGFCILRDVLNDFKVISVEQMCVVHSCEQMILGIGHRINKLVSSLTYNIDVAIRQPFNCIFLTDYITIVGERF